MLSPEEGSPRSGPGEGFPQKPRPQGKPVDRLTWGRGEAGERREARLPHDEPASTRQVGVTMLGAYHGQA